MHNCDTCVHRRGIISENGFHFICGLHWRSARNCILGKKQHYQELPKYQWIEKEVKE
jgi:hypothetical protein